MTHDDAADPDGALEVTGGDAEAARLLRERLRALRAQVGDDAALRHRLDEVLAGRATVRGLLDVPSFAALVDDGMRAAQRAWAELGPEERERAARAGRPD